MKKQIMIIGLVLTFLGCREVENSQQPPIIRIFEQDDCIVYERVWNGSTKNILCPTDEVDPFWVYATFHIPTFLPPKYALCREELMAASPKGIEFEQFLEDVKYQGKAAISGSSYHPEFDQDGRMTSYSFRESQADSLSKFQIIQDSNFLIHSIDGDLQKVVYEYDDAGMRVVKEYNNGILVQQIDIH
jgi:hypothetical protein